MTITAARDVDGATAAAACVVQTHQRLVDFIRVGMTLAEIDAFVARTLTDLRCASAFLRYRIRGYPPFPSNACLSLNDCIVHGTHDMTREPLRPGDLLSIDIGVKHEGWIGDAAWTYAVAEASDQAMALMQCGRQSLQRGIAAMQAGRPLIDWARAVQRFVERECGFHLVRGLGGHGYGRQLHDPPYISNVVPGNQAEWPEAGKIFSPGMLLAVEPMIAAGTGQIRSKERSWPIFTADGSLSVHYEANVLITEGEPANLTEAMNQLPDVIAADG